MDLPVQFCMAIQWPYCQSHSGSSFRDAGNVLRPDRDPAGPVRRVLAACGSPDLLFLCYLKGRVHWSRGGHVAAGVQSHCKLPQYANDGPEIATTLALLCGSIALGIGLLRLRFILVFIPIPAVMGFMTSSAFTIAASQVPGFLGIGQLLNIRAATHLVVINTLKNLFLGRVGFLRVTSPRIQSDPETVLEGE